MKKIYAFCLFAMAMLSCTIAAHAQEAKQNCKFGMELQQHLCMNVNHSEVLTRGEAPIYTLDGREVKCRPTPGIYIQGGKKMVILK